MPPLKIDREKVRAAVRKLGDEYMFHMLDDAIDLLPPAKLNKLLGQYLDVTKLAPEDLPKPGLLVEIEAFEKASRAGRYYESFDVNSKNHMQKSVGTRSWIADCRRLVSQCLEATSMPAADRREALDRIIGLLRHIDEGHDDIVFFADEGGSWQVGIDWAKVFPCWFSILAETTAPEEYARRVVADVEEFESFRRDEHLATAERIGTPKHRAALRAASRVGAQSRGGVR